MKLYRYFGRWRLLAATCMLAFAASWLASGPAATFRLWGFNVSPPGFEDARGITAAIESLRDGHDPWLENPRDPWGRKFNYPRVWLELEKTGMDQSHTALFAGILTALFFTGALLFPPANLGWTSSILMLAVVFSPAVMLGIQTGNIDQFMFFLLAVWIAGSASNRWWARLLGLGSLLAGMSLKIYPIFGAGAACGWKRKHLVRAAALISAAVGLYVATHWQEIATIRQATPMSGTASYGRDVLWMRIQQESAIAGQAAKTLSWAGVAAGLALAPLGFRAGRARSAGERPPDCRALAAFQCGAGVYCGTFLLGTNWDYRLMFLAFTIPLLAWLARDGDGLLRRIARVALATVILSCWHLGIWNLVSLLPFGSPASVALDEGCNWLVFWCLMFVGGFTLGPPIQHPTVSNIGVICGRRF